MATDETFGPLLARTAHLASAFCAGLGERRVGASAEGPQLQATLGGPLPAHGEDPTAVIERLARDVQPGLVATAGPRYFGFVTGGSVPAAVGADWLTTVWDQVGGLYACSPAAAVVEEIAAGWLVELFGLPAGTSTGFTTGCTMANFTALAAARHAVLGRCGWDVEADGLYGAPRVPIIVGAEAHASIYSALQMLGFGRARVERIPTDPQGRMQAAALADALDACDGPAIVCAQAGNVNTGAFDPLPAITAAVRRHGGWLHVDGAFGLWAACSPALRAHLEGMEQADSWATDAHKWLNVPYDSGLVFVRDPTAHRAAMGVSAAYLTSAPAGGRDGYDWVPEASRRARGFAVYAALRSLGRNGLAALVERCCTLARRMAARLQEDARVQILNEVVLNQVLVRFGHPGAVGSDAAADELTRAVVEEVQREGTCWAGPSRWHGMEAMRISVCNWSTSAEDIDRSAAAVLRCLDTVGAESAR